MKSLKFSESQIVSTLKLAENGMSVTKVCLSHDVSNATFYRWCAKYSGMDISMLSKVKHLEAENNGMKLTYAELQLDNDVLKDVMTKKWQSHDKVN